MPLYITAQVTAADDDAMVIVNSSDVTSWGNDGSAVRKIRVHAGSNPLLIRVLNRRSYTGGHPLLGGHPPEGWKFSVVLAVEVVRSSVYSTGGKIARKTTVPDMASGSQWCAE